MRTLPLVLGILLTVALGGIVLHEAVPHGHQAHASVLGEVRGRDYGATLAAMIEGVPVCADHAPLVWHALVEQDADGSIRCSYGHTHFDDPRVLDGVFGALPYGEISYPWETLDENHNKHNVYKWVTYQNPTCESLTGTRTLRYARVQYHGDGHGGALTRFHSYYAQLEWCDPANPAAASGRFTHGGWLDYGRLFVRTALNAETYVPLPGDPPLSSLRRIHGSPEAFRGDFTWYGASGSSFSIGLRNEDWGPVNPTSPNVPLLFYDGTQNGSYQAPLHLVALNIAADRMNFNGYTDRYGQVVQGCTGVSLDCIPLIIQNMPAGESQFRGEDRQARLCCREYDVLSPVTSKSLLSYPN